MWHVLIFAGLACLQVIKDFSASFYSAALVPAANVHVSLGDGASQKGQYLRPEVMALQGTPPEARGLAHKQQQNQSQVCFHVCSIFSSSWKVYPHVHILVFSIPVTYKSDRLILTSKG